MSRHHAAFKNDKRWKASRAACLDRDDYACVWCSTSAEDLEDPLEADHILEAHAYPELVFEIENLRTLCRPCHIERGRQSAAGVGIARAEWISPRYAEWLAGVS